MGKLNGESHDLLRKGGFHYDKTWDRYFLVREAIWEVERRIEKGRRQFAIPARTKQEFLIEEERMATKLLKRWRARTGSGMEAVRHAEVAPKTEKRGRVGKPCAGVDASSEKREAAQAESSGAQPKGEEVSAEPKQHVEDARAETLFNPVKAEVELLQAQAAKLRTTIARRRAIPGASNESDDVPAIIAHYEKMLAELEGRIARISGRL